MDARAAQSISTDERVVAYAPKRLSRSGREVGMATPIRHPLLRHGRFLLQVKFPLTGKWALAYY